MITKLLNISKGSGKPSKESAGKLTKVQVEQIAKDKLPDMNTDSVEAGMKIIEGTARSMGIQVE
jgi:large subunit ribosomal protein L11